MSKKVQVGFDDDAVAIIARLQKASGATSAAEVLRAAVGLYDWAHEQIEQGYAVGAFKPGSPAKEVAIFRFRPKRKDTEQPPTIEPPPSARGRSAEIDPGKEEY